MEAKKELERIIEKCRTKKYDCNNDKENLRLLVQYQNKGEYMVTRSLDTWEDYHCFNCKYYKGEKK